MKGDKCQNGAGSTRLNSKDEAAKMVIETSRPIAEIARQIGVNDGTLGSWVVNYRKNHTGEEPPLSITDRARLRAREKENREPTMKAEFLGKTADFFAQEPR
ncbi:MAG: transposase [Pseudonocardiaceae bacterium]